MKILIKITVLITTYLILLFTTTSCFVDGLTGIRGSRVVVSEDRDINSNFEFIKVQQGINLYITEGNSTEISVEADDNIMELLMTEVNNNELKIGMLSKAIQLEKNEDFLGDIHLELANALIENNLSENALVELSTYKKHRELKGWNLPESYNLLLNKVIGKTTSIKVNQELYKQYVPLAEEYAYQDIKWTELVLIDTWKNDKQKEKLKFSNSKEIEFTVSNKRFKSFKEFKIGNVFDFKLHKEELVSEEIPKRNNFMYQFSTPKIEYKYIPLLSKKSNKADWSILEDEFAVIDYINKEKNVIHAISSNNQEIFYKDDISKYNINDFIKGKLLVTKRMDETRIDLKEIELIDSIKGIEHFPKTLAIVDNINNEKKLFHFVADRKIHGIVRFNETEIRPKEGSFLEVWFAKKIDKKRNREIYKPLKIIESENLFFQHLANISFSLAKFRP